jgi:hypothetical protein
MLLYLFKLFPLIYCSEHSMGLSLHTFLKHAHVILFHYLLIYLSLYLFLNTLILVICYSVSHLVFLFVLLKNLILLPLVS